MRLPQSITSPFSTRAFFAISVTVFLAIVSLGAQAATQQLTCTPASLHLGDVPIGQTETQLVILTNTGETPVTVSAISLTATEFSVSQLSLPLTLSAGESVALNATFSPTTTGWAGGRVVFTSTASNPVLQLQLGGTGVTTGSLTASPASLSFGQVAVGHSSTQSVVLTSGRTSKTTLSALQMTGSGFSVSGLTLPLTLGEGQSVAFSVTFTPQEAGAAGGSVFLYGPALNIPFTGTGTGTATGQLVIAPAPLNFGNVALGTTETESISMNATGASVTVYSGASSSSQFVLEGASFPFTIAAGQSLSFNVGFTPANTGLELGSLSFTSNASNPTTIESLTGTGTAVQYSVNLWWNSGSNVVGYNVYRSTSANGTYAKINSTLDPTTAYTDSTVASGQNYYYEATSVNSSGQESARSTPPVEAVVP